MHDRDADRMKLHALLRLPRVKLESFVGYSSGQTLCTPQCNQSEELEHCQQDEEPCSHIEGEISAVIEDAVSQQ